MLNFFRSSVVFLLSVVVFFLFEIFTTTINISRLFNVIENVLFAFVLVILIFLFNKRILKKFYLIFAILLFNLGLLFETFYYYHFMGIFSESVLFVILESNGTEMKEFFMSFIDTSVIFLIIITIVLIIFSLKRVDYILKVATKIRLKKIKIFLLIFSVLVFLKWSQLIVFNVPYLLARTPISYNQEMKKLDVYGESHKLGNFSNVRRADGFSGKEVYVIVVGESTSRKHFDLQGGYYRETTPKLNTNKNDLNIYNDVISPNANTIVALYKA